MTAKRIFDLTVSVCGLAALALPLLGLCVFLKLYNPGSLFFRQSRVGLGGREFDILKFRTMAVGASAASGLTVGNDQRITVIGKILRKTKLDELPQLLNILMGDMSLVGPRPEVPEFAAKYSQLDRDLILSIRPGLTDFASIRFRNESELLAKQSDPSAYYEKIIMPAKLRYCRFYVRRSSVRLDLYIIALTILVVTRDALGSYGRSARFGRALLLRS